MNTATYYSFTSIFQKQLNKQFFENEWKRQQFKYKHFSKKKEDRRNVKKRTNYYYCYYRCYYYYYYMYLIYLPAIEK